jgi:two-component system, NarL family, response regulator YdfI
MIDVLVEASSPDLYAEMADLLGDRPQIRLIESSIESDPHAVPEDAHGSEDRPQPGVVVLAIGSQSEATPESLTAAASGWDALGVPLVLLADDPARWLADPLPPGVRAVLPRNVTPAEMVGAIEAVAAGLYVFHPSDVDSVPMLRPREGDMAPELAPPLTESFAEPGSPAHADLARAGVVEHLTPREIEVLQLLSEGLGNKEIASRLNISEHTAKFHVASIMGKLGATSRTEAVTLGIRRGLVMI